ncbi:MAG: hypothetical protein ACM3ZO_11510 [Clostridia bacterium]
MSHYTDEQRLEVVKNSRRLSRNTARLWQNYDNLPGEDVRCLSTPFRQTVDPFWPCWPDRLLASAAG